MSQAGKTLRIEDLSNPILTPMQKMAREAMSQVEVDLSEEGILMEARDQTGLENFGNDDFRERLRVWLQSVSEDEGLAPVGRYGVRRDIVRYAANRLRFEDLWRRHPEIDEVEISAPIIIGGLPRSGTTHLLNLIAADSRLRSLPYWESLEPVPDFREGPAADGVDPRLQRCREAYAQQVEILPLLRNMHDMAPEHVHEEIELQGLDFASYELEWIATVPRWRDYYLSHDQTAHYAYMKRVLKALQWLRGPDRWILKSPQHMEQLGPLVSTFPDATFILTHRDPVSVIRSAITMLAYGDRIRRHRVDAPAVAAYWSERVETLLRSCVRDRELLPEDRSLDVLFHEFMADDIAMVERVYELAGLEMTQTARAELEAYMAANPRGKFGQIEYDLKGDFGVDPDRLRERFAFYFEKFPIQAETSL
ncbi:sulfotransferase [Myxococcota bacterium]|nr:sulfotransferase [Myxococcota bacterium]